MDIDIIGVLLKFSLRGSFFPYLGTTERERIGLSEPESAEIGSVHPVEVLAPVQSASAFEAMDDHVFSSFAAWDPEFAASPDNAAYERERRLLAVKRRNIFATEMSDPDYYFRGPVETPPRIVFKTEHSAIRSAMRTRGPRMKPLPWASLLARRSS